MSSYWASQLRRVGLAISSSEELPVSDQPCPLMSAGKGTERA